MNYVDSAPLVDADGNPIGSSAGRPAGARSQPQDRAETRSISSGWTRCCGAIPRTGRRTRSPCRSRPPPRPAVTSRRPTRFSRGPSARSSARAGRDIAAVQLRLQRPKVGAMIHVAAVSDLMRHHPAQQMRRSKDQPPVVADRAACRATAPAARGVADRDRADADSGAARRLPRSPRSAGPAPGREDIVRSVPANASSGPPQLKHVTVKAGRPRQALDPSAAEPRRPSNGMVEPGANGSPGSISRELRLDPVGLRPAQSSAARRLIRRG